MAKQNIQMYDNRPQVDKSAPWSPHVTSKYVEIDKSRAVVYVVAADGGDWCKLGHTTALKKRMAQLQRDYGAPVNVFFWAEFHREIAMAVERATKKMLQREGYEKDGEWFRVEASVAGHRVMDAVAKLGAAPKAIAGDPSAVEEPQTEVSEILQEPSNIYRKRNRVFAAQLISGSGEDWS